MIPERAKDENIFEYVLRAAAELRENRPQRLEDQCRRIEQKARRHGNESQERTEQAHRQEGR